MGKILLPQGFDVESFSKWYLVANRAEASVYQTRRGQPFHFLKRLRNPRARFTELELVADRPGRRYAKTWGSSIRHGCQPRSLQHDRVAMQFAQRIADLLDKDLRAGAFTELIVLAEPRFLGFLHRSFSQQVKDRLSHEIHHEWNQGSDRELEQYLQTKLSAEAS